MLSICNGGVPEHVIIRGSRARASPSFTIILVCYGGRSRKAVGRKSHLRPEPIRRQGRSVCIEQSRPGGAERGKSSCRRTRQRYIPGSDARPETNSIYHPYVCAHIIPVIRRWPA